MLARLTSGFVGIAIFLWLCFWGLRPFAVGVTVVAGLGAAEFIAAYRGIAGETLLSLPSRSTWLNGAATWVGIAFPLLAFNTWLEMRQEATLYALALAFIVGMFSLLISRAIRTGRTLGRMTACYGLVGLVYVGALFSGLVIMRGIPGRVNVFPFGGADLGAWAMLMVAASVWMADSAAYFAGRQFGKRPLAPSLSPKKTIEGATAGLLCASLFGAAFAAWLHIPPIHGVAVGAIAGLVGPLGDLFESGLKREIGVKDFGAVMPGHGGTLDRFDSLLFVCPLAYLYLRLIAGL